MESGFEVKVCMIQNPETPLPPVILPIYSLKRKVQAARQVEDLGVLGSLGQEVLTWDV